MTTDGTQNRLGRVDLFVSDVVKAVIAASLISTAVGAMFAWDAVNDAGGWRVADRVVVPVDAVLLTLLVLATVELLWVWGVALGRGIDPIDDLGLRFEPVDILLGLLSYGLVLAGSVTVWLIGRWLADGSVESTTETQFALELSAFSETEVLLMFAVFAVIVPIAEELMFRAFAMGALMRRFPTVVAWIGAAVIFGLAHARTLSTADIPVVIWATWAGLVWGALTLRTGRLGAGIFGHMLNNAVFVFVVT